LLDGPKKATFVKRRTSLQEHRAQRKAWERVLSEEFVESIDPREGPGRPLA
jgi:hypothetical protein